MYPYLKISDIASKYVQLHYDPVSDRQFGKCPFCNGETETFSTNDKKNTFFCLACGAYGDKKELLSRLHIGQDGQMYQTEPKNQIMLDIYAAAACYYYENLMKEPNAGLDYFLKRGLSKNSIMNYGLGYSPDAFSELYKILVKDYAHEDLMKSGLFKVSKKGYPYDLFRNRVMFPIIDENGDVIAFGGRILGQGEAKYINSPETEIFSKRKYLYGFPYASGTHEDKILICEGYMDQIAIDSLGDYDSAAILGTALTEEHAKLISRYYQKVCLILDSDAAGIHAAKRSIEILNAAGLAVTVPDLKPAKDPDEFIRKKLANHKTFENRICAAMSSYHFLARNAASIDEIINILLRQAM